jgi:hypothetical protein
MPNGSRKPPFDGPDRQASDALDPTERPHPSEHWPISLTRRGKASGSQNPILVIDDRRDMQILVGVHTAGVAAPRPFLHVHAEPPGSTVLRRLRQDRGRGQDSHLTGGRALLGSQASARQNTSPQGGPGRPTGPEKDTAGQSECRSGHTGTSCSASLTKWSIAVRFSLSGNWPAFIADRTDIAGLP